MFTISFEDGTLRVFKGDRQLIEQPFCPGLNGAQVPWANEQQAIDWWLAVKHVYEYEPPDIEPPPVDNPPPYLQPQD